MPRIVYFSSTSGNTARFVEKLGVDAVRLPLTTRQETYEATEPYLLVTPTYGGGCGPGAVPKQVIKFLNLPGNRELIRAVAAAGNTNFGAGYGLAGKIIADKCGVPLIHRFEILGTSDDVEAILGGMEQLWPQAS